MKSRRRMSIIDRLEANLLRGSALSILSLGLATIGVVVAASVVVSFFHIHASGDNLSFVDATWEILQRAIDPGQLANESKWSSRITLIVVTGIGLLLMSTLISIVNSTLERRLEFVRRGRRPIEVSGHIAILGWNSMGTKYIEELAEALQDGEDIHVVLLADHDPVDLMNTISDDLLRRPTLNPASNDIRNPERWLAIRRGDAFHTADLLKFARLDAARAAIVLGTDGSDEGVTTIVLAILAALQNGAASRAQPLTIVAAFKDSLLGMRLRHRIRRLTGGTDTPKNPLAELIPVTPNLIRSGIEAQVARHRGLSEVYRDLIDFDGEEIYLVQIEESSLVFGDLLRISDATPMGLRRGEDIELWPAWDAPLAHAEAIVIAHDQQSATRAIGQLDHEDRDFPSRLGRPSSSESETFLIVGWNSDAFHLLDGLRRSAPISSRMDLLISEETLLPSEVREQVDNVLIRTRTFDHLDDPSFVAAYNHVVVLSHDSLTDQQSDSRVLVDILACRSHTEDVSDDRAPLTVVAELRQRASKHIAGTRLADDLLVNDSLAASATVQLAVHPHLYPILETLLTPSSKVHLHSLGHSSREFHSKTIGQCRLELAQTTGEIPIAVRREMPDPRVVVNPHPDFLIEDRDELLVLSVHGD